MIVAGKVVTCRSTRWNTVLLGILDSDAYQRGQLVCHLNLSDHLYFHILCIDSHVVSSSATNPVGSVLMTSPFRYLLLSLTSLTIVSGSISARPH